jgi:hypothetical protein
MHNGDNRSDGLSAPPSNGQSCEVLPQIDHFKNGLQASSDEDDWPTGGCSHALQPDPQKTGQIGRISIPTIAVDGPPNTPLPPQAVSLPPRAVHKSASFRKANRIIPNQPELPTQQLPQPIEVSPTWISGNIFEAAFYCFFTFGSYLGALAAINKNQPWSWEWALLAMMVAWNKIFISELTSKDKGNQLTDRERYDYLLCIGFGYLSKQFCLWFADRPCQLETKLLRVDYAVADRKFLIEGTRKQSGPFSRWVELDEFNKMTIEILE